MAITACFAGPVFNMLIGLSLGYELYFSESDVSETEVSFYYYYYLGKGEGLFPLLFSAIVALAETLSFFSRATGEAIYQDLSRSYLHNDKLRRNRCNWAVPYWRAESFTGILWLWFHWPLCCLPCVEFCCCI